ncbi:MAG: hypothetical protein M1541_20910 [Acidobacteria bacterium]|nr:hypothetical protein [Acidobacteriota bacterium]
MKTHIRRTILVVPCVALLLPGQTAINGGRQISGAWDAAGAVSTKPAKSGTVLPATCGVGEQFFKIDAAPGQNLYGCTAVNTWTAMSGGSGGALADPGANGIVKRTAPNTTAVAAAADLPPHASRHKHGGDDEIATATPAANAIPETGADGKLEPSWMVQTDVFNTTEINISDDLCKGGSDNYKLLGNTLFASAIGSGGAVAYGTGDADHPCVVTLLSGTTVDTGYNLAFGGGNNLLTNATARPWRLQWIVRTTTGAGYRLRLGMADSYIAAAPATGIWFRFDKNASYNDTNFMVEACSAGTCTAAIDTGIAPANVTYYKFELRHDGAGNVYWSVNGVENATPITTNLPATAIFPAAIFATMDTSARYFYVDRFAFQVKGLGR